MNLEQLLNTECAAVHLQTSDWRDAIRKTGSLMVNSGAVTPAYVDAMIETAEELGPYIVIAPGIAMPHARPERGVIHSAISIVTLDPAVDFGNSQNDPVHLVFAFATVDNKQHIKALTEISSVFSQLFEKFDGIGPLIEANDPDTLVSTMLSMVH